MSKRRIIVFVLAAALVAVALWRRRLPKERPPAPAAIHVASTAALDSRRPPVSAAPTDLATALRATLESRDRVQRTTDFARLLQQWIAQDPAAAAEFVRQLPAGAERTMGVTMVL